MWKNRKTTHKNRLGKRLKKSGERRKKKEKEIANKNQNLKKKHPPFFLQFLLLELRVTLEYFI